MFRRISEKYQQWRYLKSSKKIQEYAFQGINISIYPGVFSPIGTRTTELFAKYLLSKNWDDKRVLELGAGSGIISFLLSEKGADVTASDITENVIKGLKKNAEMLQINLDIIQSDLFQHLKSPFEIIIINPPFFNQNPVNDTEKAWYCGVHFEFFENLFSQFSLRDYNEEMWMILSVKSQIDTIKSIALKHNLIVDEVIKLTGDQEKHIVFKIKNK